MLLGSDESSVQLNGFDAFNVLDPFDVSTKIHDQDLGVLSGADNTSVITLRAQNPACVPFGKVEQLMPGLHIPHLDVGVVTSTDQSAAYTVDVEAANQVLVGTHLSETLAGVGIPNADHLIITGRCDVPAILGELRTGQALGMPSELANVLARLDVPQLDAEISRARHNGVAPHLDCIDRAVVTSKLLDQVTRVAVPDANGKVLAAGYDVLVIKSEIENGCRVVSKPADRLALLVVEHIGLIDNLVRSNDKTALKGVHIPNTDSLVAGASDDFMSVKTIDAIFVPIQINRSGLSSLPTLVQLLLDTVDFSPIIDRRNSRNSETTSRRDGLASCIGGGCLSKARLAPNVLVIHNLVPALAHRSSLGESRSIKIGENVNSELGRKSGDKVDRADSSLLRLVFFGLDTGKGHRNSDTALAVVTFVVGSRIQPHVVESLTGKVLVLHSSGCLGSSS
ncbi:hypothetical protein HG531_011358 [Fusarium graminearum]|nr:hypothetical protein HG531_011358 [Fusarium graminearum]